MNSAVAVLCCYYISFASGVSDLENNLQITNVTNAPEEELRFKNSINPINETELYTGEQADKKNDQRSYVVLNHKFKSHFFDGKSLPIENNKSYEFSFIAFDTIKGNHLAIRSKQKNRSRNKHVQPTTCCPRPHKRKHNYGTKFMSATKNKLIRLVPISNIHKTKIHSDISQKYTLFYLHPVGLRPFARRHTTRKPAAGHYIRVLGSPNPPLTWNYHRNQNAKSLPLNSLQRDFNSGNETYRVFNFDNTILGTFRRNILKPDQTKTCYNPNCKTILNKNKQRLNNGIRKDSLCACDDGTAQDIQSKEDDTHREALAQIMKELNDLLEKN